MLSDGFLIREANELSRQRERRAVSSSGSRSSQSARGSGHSRSRTPRQDKWSVSTEEGEASDPTVPVTEEYEM